MPNLYRGTGTNPNRNKTQCNPQVPTENKFNSNPATEPLLNPHSSAHPQPETPSFPMNTNDLEQEVLHFMEGTLTNDQHAEENKVVGPRGKKNNHATPYLQIEEVPHHPKNGPFHPVS